MVIFTSYWFDLKESLSSIVNGDQSAASIYGNATVTTSDEKDKEIKEDIKEHAKNWD